MKILQIYDLAPDNSEPTEGVGLAIRGLSRSLAALGHEVWMLAGAGRARQPLRSINGVEVVRLDTANLMRRTWSPTNLTWARQLLFPAVASCNWRSLKRFSEFDVFHGHVYSSGLIALALGKRFDGRVINTIHGSYYGIWEELLPRGGARYVRHAERSIALLLARHVDFQIHTGGYFCEMLKAWGADPRRLATIHNGVDRSLFLEATPPRAASPPIFFTARRLVKKNGLDILIDAFHQVAGETDAELRIAGQGPELPFLQQQCVALGIDRKVSFVGPLGRREIPAFITGGQVAVIPSLAEASSLFLLECMALRRPVVCSDVGGLVEVADHDTAWIARAADSEDLARQMLSAVYDWDSSVNKTERAQALAESRFTWDSVAERTVRLYER